VSLDTRLPAPQVARSFRATRRVRLADVAPPGRVRLDAVARWLQDCAIDDVAETGWGAPAHLWFVRRIRIDVLVPPRSDRTIELVTWCSGVAALAAGRRWSLTGDRGGRIEVDSVWIHLDRDGRPQRIEDFGVYAEAAGDRPVSTRPGLPQPPESAPRRAWPLRSSDVDLHGHVNNAVHWEAVEDVLVGSGAVDPMRPYRAELDYREPLDLGDPLELVRFDPPGAAALGFVCGAAVRAVARLAALAPLAAPSERP
jgi:acyl-ACP thioesterase